MIAWIILAGIAAAYFTRVFLFQEKTSHWGPFPSKKRFVRSMTRSGETSIMHQQPVTVFDWVRHLTTRCYDVTEPDELGDIYWYTRQSRMEMWTCPTCLSFWMAFPFTALVMLTMPEQFNAGYALLGLTIICGISWALNMAVDFWLAHSQVVYAELQVMGEDDE